MGNMDFDPDGTRLPIKVDSASNGEYAPRPLSPAERQPTPMPANAWGRRPGVRD
jgi:hypothetical protein